MVTLTGKITDVTGNPPASITNITVKAPSARIGGGSDIIVTSPARVTFDKLTGEITLRGLHVGLSWLYVEGDGWSDSVPLAVVEGFQLILEAVANASGVPGMADYISMLQNSGVHARLLARAAVDGELGAVVRLAQVAAATAAQAATTAEQVATSAEQVATTAQNTVDTYTPRVVALEALGGLSAESPVDGQTANLVAQPGTLTHAAIFGPLEDTYAKTTPPPPGTILGPNLATATGWTLPANWTGTYDTGFGYSGPLSGESLTWAIPALTTGETYVLEFTLSPYRVNNTFPGEMSVSIAGVSLDPIYKALRLDTQTYQIGFTPKTSDPLKITPLTSNVTQVTGVKLYQVVGAFPPTMELKDSQGETDTHVRTAGSSLFVGRRAGEEHSGSDSVGIGRAVMMRDVSGFFNVAIGTEALRDSRRVTRNIAIGHQSLMRNRGGDRNVAVGPFTGHNIVSGNENVIMGVDCLWQGEGSRNIAIGMYAMDKADGANDMIAIGRRAAAFATSGAWNIAIGDETMQATNPGTYNVAVGNSAARENSGTYNVAVGAEALHGAVGANATETVAIGYRAGYSITTARRNTLVGHQAGREITTGSTNTVLGNLAAPTLASGTNNILIGYDVARGKVSGDNCIIIGGVPYSENPDVTGWLNIANTIYGRRSEKKVGIGVEYPAAHLHIMASSGEPGSAPLRFSPGPLMDTALSGNMEYDGTDLYFTIDGVRKKFAFQNT